MNVQRIAIAAVCTGLASCIPACPASARPGDLDPSFGTGGVAATGVAAGVANAVVLQPDGKIVVALSPVARGPQTTALVRLLPNGAPDASFGQGGVAPLALQGFPFTPVVNSAALQSDGKILLCGGGLPLSGAPAFVARVLPDGSPDDGFGSGGTLTNVVPYAANVVLLDPAGYVLAGGGSTFAAATALARLTPDGAFDASFGSGGVASFSSPIGAVYGVAPQTDGKYLLLGAGVLRLNADGSEDSGDHGGRLAAGAHAGNEAFSFAGKVLLTQAIAQHRDESAVQTARYLRSGARDGSFASPDVDFGYGPSNVPAYLHEAPGGALVVDGTSAKTSGAVALGVVRYRANGTPDASFGNAGAVVTQLGTQLDGAGEFALEPDGSIVVAAVAVVGGTPSLVVVRYLGR